jgi:hypothetical protein
MSIRAWAAILGLVCLALAGLESTAIGIKRIPPVEASDYPEAVHITARHSVTGAKGKCSGVLIAPALVLTAAHSVRGFDTWEVHAPYVKAQVKSASVKSARVHPESRRDPLSNDIAVLVLDRAIPLEGGYPKLFDGDLLPLDSRVLVVGRVSNGVIAEDRFFKAPSSVVAFPANTNVYGGHPQIVEEGDSGGPVYLPNGEHVVVGIVSGHLSASRANVRTDGFAPIHRGNRQWLLDGR